MQVLCFEELLRCFPPFLFMSTGSYSCTNRYRRLMVTFSRSDLVLRSELELQNRNKQLKAQASQSFSSLSRISTRPLFRQRNKWRLTRARRTCAVETSAQHCQRQPLVRYCDSENKWRLTRAFSQHMTVLRRFPRL